VLRCSPPSTNYLNQDAVGLGSLPESCHHPRTEPQSSIPLPKLYTPTPVQPVCCPGRRLDRDRVTEGREGYSIPNSYLENMKRCSLCPDDKSKINQSSFPHPDLILLQLSLLLIISSLHLSSPLSFFNCLLHLITLFTKGPMKT
jgi:hypothetical protein